VTRYLVIRAGIVPAIARSSARGQQTVRPQPKERDGIFRQYARGLLARVNYQPDA
jgi:hypothetical protein